MGFLIKFFSQSPHPGQSGGFYVNAASVPPGQMIPIAQAHPAQSNSVPNQIPQTNEQTVPTPRKSLDS